MKKFLLFFSIILFSGFIATGCFQSDTSTDSNPAATQCSVDLYNTCNDTCISGYISIDYYFNGTLMATVAPGYYTTITIDAGTYNVYVCQNGYSSVLWSYGSTEITEDWYFYYGCYEPTVKGIENQSSNELNGGAGSLSGELLISPYK